MKFIKTIKSIIKKIVNLDFDLIEDLDFCDNCGGIYLNGTLGFAENIPMNYWPGMPIRLGRKRICLHCSPNNFKQNKP